VLLIALSASAACPATASALESVLDEAQIAFSRMDSAGFRTSTDEVALDADCLSEPVTPALAARTHRVRGLREFVDGREDAARQAFAAARAIDPAYAFPESVLPGDHPARKLYADAAGLTVTTTQVPSPTSGRLDFDGAPAVVRPVERATLAVWVDGAGKVGGSGYLWPGDPLFPYPAVVSSTATATGKKKGPNVPLLVASAGCAVAAGVTYALAGESYDRFWDEGTPRGELEALQGQTNTLVYISAGAAVLAAGTGVGAVIAGHW
jgi:hypothetical protein